MTPAELRKLLAEEPDTTLYGVIPLHADALLRVAEAAERLREACTANMVDRDVNALPHGNLVGFPLDRREDAKKFCAVLNEVDASLAALREVKP